jgi:DNA repair exonuclease SbcCD nuclease subunit
MSGELIVGDMHLKVSNLDGVRAILAWLLGVARTERPTRVILLGDVFHTHAVVRSEVLREFTAFVVSMSSIAPLICVVGNHDMASATQESVHALEPFKQYTNVTVVDIPTVIDGDLFIPFCSSADAWLLAFDAFPTVKRVYCHQPFLGADMGFVKSIDGVPVPTRGTPIISGHIHIAQQLGDVWFPGSLYAQESADADQTKGAYLVTSQSHRLIEAPMPRWRNFHATTADYEAVISQMLPTDHNHLVLAGPSAELTAVLASDLFKKLKRAHRFSLRKEPTSNTKVAARVSAKSVKDAVTSYIENVYSGGVDKAALTAACLEVLSDG